MDSTLKQRLIGAAVLAALAIIFLPMLLKGPDVREPDATEVPLTMPAAPGQEFETRELPLTVPDMSAQPNGVLGMERAGRPPAPAVETMAGPDADAAASESVAASADDAAAAAPATAAPATAAPDTPATAAARVEAPPAQAAVESAAGAGAGDYMINVGSFSNLGNARALVTRLRAAGLPVKADQVTVASGKVLRVRVGPFADRTAAESARLRTENVSGSGARIVVLDAGADIEPAPAPAAAAKPVQTPATAAPPTPTAPTTPVATVPTASSGFAVQLSAPSVEAEALALRDRARGMGFNSFVQRVETDGGTRFRVRVGPVADRAAAVALRDEANGRLGTQGIVLAHP